MPQSNFRKQEKKFVGIVGRRFIVIYIEYLGTFKRKFEKNEERQPLHIF